MKNLALAGGLVGSGWSIVLCTERLWFQFPVGAAPGQRVRSLVRVRRAAAYSCFSLTPVLLSVSPPSLSGTSSKINILG